MRTTIEERLPIGMSNVISPTTFPVVPSGALHVYCLQCLFGREIVLAERLSTYYPEIDAMPVLQETHRSQGGHKALKQQVMLPGYVFLFSKEPVPFHQILLTPDVMRFLSYGSAEDRALRGEDLAFANWIKRHGGLLSCSKAVREGNQLRIIHGPLKDHIGTVKKVDRHNRNVCLSIKFSGSVSTVWMPFQWSEEMENTGLSGITEFGS